MLWLSNWLSSTFLFLFKILLLLGMDLILKHFQSFVFYLCRVELFGVMAFNVVVIVVRVKCFACVVVGRGSSKLLLGERLFIGGAVVCGFCFGRL